MARIVGRFARYPAEPTARICILTAQIIEVLVVLIALPGSGTRDARDIVIWTGHDFDPGLDAAQWTI